jgi:hypothetical protein
LQIRADQILAAHDMIIAKRCTPPLSAGTLLNVRRPAYKIGFIDTDAYIRARLSRNGSNLWVDITISQAYGMQALESLAQRWGCEVPPWNPNARPRRMCASDGSACLTHGVIKTHKHTGDTYMCSVLRLGDSKVYEEIEGWKAAAPQQYALSIKHKQYELVLEWGRLRNELQGEARAAAAQRIYALLRAANQGGWEAEQEEEPEQPGKPQLLIDFSEYPEEAD